MRSILYRFPDLGEFERMVAEMGQSELELGLPAGESVDDGEWVLAVFELGSGRRATSAAARASSGPDGDRLVFEPRDAHKLAQFAAREAKAGGRSPSGADLRRVTPAVVSSFRDSGTGARVMVIDDDPDIREVVAAMLEAVGLLVTAVGSAEEALEEVRAERPDLLVLDWNLPKMTGIDLCRVLRKDASMANVPVLFLTANASSQDMVDAFASGADDYVVKPFRAPELGARIFSLLRRFRSLQNA